MNRLACLISLLLLLLVVGTPGIRAEKQLPPKLQKLTDNAYHCTLVISKVATPTPIPHLI